MNENFLLGDDDITPDNASTHCDEWDNFAMYYDLVLGQVVEAVASQACLLCSLGPRKEVLDVGCGTGALTIHAAKLGSRVLAIDSSTEMLRLCAGKARGLEIAERVSVIKRDAQDLSIIEDSRFDSVFSCFGATQFSNRSKAIKEMYRVLVNDGKCVLASWDEPSKMKLFQALLSSLTLEVPLLTASSLSGWHPHLTLETLKGESLGYGFSRVNVFRVCVLCYVVNPINYGRILYNSLPGLTRVWNSLSGIQQEKVLSAFQKESDKCQGIFECSVLICVGIK